MTEKKKESDIVADDVKEMADLYIQLDSLLGSAKLDLKPTSEDLQKMVVSLFIHRADSGTTTSTSAPAPAKKADAKFPDRECPGCHTMVAVKYGKESGKPFYLCSKCDAWVNDDGTMSQRKKK